ncbi:Gfo/Idh/MocA family protein [Prosthecobacter dejongeii]|uniref:Putative dehydrogenase n=1 Tax=Prosthecobacter dejongeii TaxID=48465 RepID=A0A7W8DNP0_9BACT|nr:Gfo/Idh/MocA family oxidoreductase [Prosthecobacter dejongeii]MBB5036512.1 putative dehydrogenase [Prosthecobacter dejongeii]
MNRRAFLATSFVSSLSAPALWSAAAPKSRVAVIGHTGRGNFGHGLDTMWLDIPETEIVAVADADAKGLAGALKKLKLDQGFADYRKMLKETRPDIVAIGPRHIDQHHEMALAAIEAGVRGIYMEKPFVPTLTQADEIIAACEKHGTKVALAHRNRYHPVLPLLKKLIAEGTIGRPLEYRVRGKEDARGGSLDLWVLGSHLFNLVHYFAGEPRACLATVYQDSRLVTKADVKEGAEGIGPLAGNEVHARFEMADGLPAFFDSVQNAGTKTAGFGVQIIGTEGIIDLRIDEEPVAHFLPGSPFDPVAEPRAWVPISTAGIGKPEPLENMRKLVGGHVAPGRDLLAAIAEGREPLCSAKDARVTLEMTMGIFESHRLHGQRVELPLKDRQHPLTRL